MLIKMFTPIIFYIHLRKALRKDYDNYDDNKI